ncbi:MAG TPA: hypothetical protein VHC20_05650 [Candidatus Paceibacterota bacterium]|nr:hypothetical protein [Candidatus Paceibacterota bacterium]
MSLLDRIIGKPVPEDLSKLPNDLAGFVAALAKRKHWSEIGYALLADIAKEPQANRERMMMFAYVSEKFDLVRTQFVPAAKAPDAGIGPPRVSFGLMLCQLGSNLLQNARTSNDRENARFLGMMADAAFTSAALCDPLQPSAPAYMAILYGTFVLKPTVALEYIANYRKTEAKLLAASIQSLAPFHRGAREMIERPAETKAFFDRATAAGIEVPDGNDGPSLRQIIDDLEKELRQRS